MKDSINRKKILYKSLFNKHNFNPEFYDIRAINQLINQQNNRLNLQFIELSYSFPIEHISKDLKLKLSFSILRQICPLCDCLPFVPFLSDFAQTKLFTRVLDEKLDIFLQQNDYELNNEETIIQQTNKDTLLFLTNSVIKDISNEVFIQQPDAKIKGSNKQGKSDSDLNDSYEELEKLIVSIQYSEDIKKIDEEKHNYLNSSKQETIKSGLGVVGGSGFELNFCRQKNRKNTAKITHMEIGVKVKNEELKYDEKIIIEQEEIEKKKLKKKFKQTKTFLLKYDKNKQLIKTKGKLFKKIIETFWEKKKIVNKLHNNNGNSSSSSHHRNCLYIHHSQTSRNDSKETDLLVPLQTQATELKTSFFLKGTQMTHKTRNIPYKAFFSNSMSSNRVSKGYKTNIKLIKMPLKSDRNNNSNQLKYPSVLINHKNKKQLSKYSSQVFNKTFAPSSNNHQSHSKNYSSCSKQKAVSNAKIKIIPFKKKEQSPLFYLHEMKLDSLIQMKFKEECALIQRIDLKKL